MRQSDPLPTQPGVTVGYLEDACRELATVEIPELNLGLFSGPNTNANKARRSTLANHAAEAANLIALGNIEGAIAQLTILLKKIDGVGPPPDWMIDSPEKTELADEVAELIELLELL